MLVGGAAALPVLRVGADRKQDRVAAGARPDVARNLGQPGLLGGARPVEAVRQPKSVPSWNTVTGGKTAPPRMSSSYSVKVQTPNLTRGCVPPSRRSRAIGRRTTSSAMMDLVACLGLRRGVALHEDVSWWEACSRTVRLSDAGPVALALVARSALGSGPWPCVMCCRPTSARLTPPVAGAKREVGSSGLLPNLEGGKGAVVLNLRRAAAATAAGSTPQLTQATARRDEASTQAGELGPVLR
jgi:hypothetical protein